MSGNSQKRPVILWDSCVLLAWFKQEPKPLLPDIGLYIKDVEDDKMVMLVSAVSFAEVLDIAESADPLAKTAGTRFRQFAKRSNVQVLDVDTRISDKVALLRERTLAVRAAGNKAAVMKIPDALIVATALIYKAHALHTFDPHILDLAGRGVFDPLLVTQPVYPEDRPLLAKLD